jgi:hypothetical protein
MVSDLVLLQRMEAFPRALMLTGASQSIQSKVPAVYLSDNWPVKVGLCDWRGLYSPMCHGWRISTLPDDFLDTSIPA